MAVAARPDSILHFNALDSWRGLAASLVLLFHLTAAGAFYHFPPIRHGGLAVPLFFVLSGFVVTHAYSQRLGTQREVAKFVVRRFGRLYPLHFVTLMAMVALELTKLFLVQRGVPSGQAPFTGADSIGGLIANLFLLQAVIPLNEYTWNAPAWSISVEFYTYLVFAAVIFLARSRIKTAAFIGFLVSGAALLAHDLSGIHLHHTDGLGLMMSLFGFFAGSVVYQAFCYAKAKGLTFGSGVELVALAVLASIFWFSPFQAFGSITLFSLVIFVFAFEGGLVSKALMTRAPTYLGKISYSLYLTHFVVLSVLNGVLRALSSVTHMRLMAPGDVISFGPPGAMDLLAAVYFLFVVGLSALTYHFIEQPGRDVFNALSNGKRLSEALSFACGNIRHTVLARAAQP